MKKEIEKINIELIREKYAYSYPDVSSHNMLWMIILEIEAKFNQLVDILNNQTES